MLEPRIKLFVFEVSHRLARRADPRKIAWDAALSIFVSSVMTKSWPMECSARATLVMFPALYSIIAIMFAQFF